MSRLSEGSGGTLASYLKLFYVSASNRVQWGDLGGALVGGLLFQVWAGVISIPLAIGEAVDQFLSSVVGAYEAGVGMITSTLIQESALAWDPFGFGLLSLPANAAVVLVAMYLAVKGYEVVTRG